MHGMKIKFLLSVLIGASSCLPAFSYVEELNFQEWVEELPLPDGWTHKGLKKGKGGAYFMSREYWLQSPVFEAAIRAVELEVYTTNPDPTRKLFLHSISNGIANESGLPVKPTEQEVYETREFLLEGSGADQFVLKFGPSGSSGYWWIRKITIRFGSAETDVEEGGSLRFWSLSAFAPKPGARVADFSVLRYARPQTLNSWRNGITVDGFHAFSKSGPVANIRVGNPTSYYSGLYVIDADADGLGLALGLLGSSGSAMELMLPIALDAARPLARLSVAYKVRELANGKSSVLNFSFRTLDDLTTMNGGDEGWSLVSDADWESQNGDAEREIDLPVNIMRNARFVCLRWSVPKKESSPIIGISNVRVSAEIEPSGFAVIVR